MEQWNNLIQPGRFCLSLMVIFAVFMRTDGVQAQNADEEFSLNISTRVLESIALFTIEDVDIRNLQPSQEQISIDPTSDPRAGYMKATGRPDTRVRISFIREQLLTHHVEEGASVIFEYNIAGNDTDEQLSSEMVEEESYEFHFNDDGEYFFWIGGNAAIGDLPGGSYSGEFVVEVEYL